VFEKVIIEKGIDPERAKRKHQKGPEISDVRPDYAKASQGAENQNSGQIGGVGHASQETKALVFLPDGKKGAPDINGEIQFRVEIVPTGKPGSGLVVQERKDDNDGEKEEKRPEGGDLGDEG